MNPMSEDLLLFKVSVARHWVTEGEALVLASDAEEAELLALREVDLDFYDAEDSGEEVTSLRVMSFDEIQSLTEQNTSDKYLIMSIAGRFGRGREVKLKELLSELCPEKVEAMRIESIERDNGQLNLLPVSQPYPR